MKKGSFRDLRLEAKLTIITVSMLILATVGLVLTSYLVHGVKLRQTYYEWAEDAAKRAAAVLDVNMVSYLRCCVDSEEFRNVRQEALAHSDPTVILDWMDRMPSFLISEALGVSEEERKDVMEKFPGEIVLSRDYETMSESLSNILNDAAVSRVALEYVDGDKVYCLLDPASEALQIGAEDVAAPEVILTAGDESIPATVYATPYGWLCSAYSPILDKQSGKTLALACVDINVTRIVSERNAFLRDVLLFVVAVALLCIVLNLYLVRRIAVHPLRALTKATCGFGKGEGPLERGDVIEVKLEAKDEIYDLYQEIRQMQTRLLDYSEDVARFTADRERSQTELRLASGIQNAMLPGELPERGEFALSASMDPAREVGGDFYDYFLLDDEHLCVLIADVTGKGVPAALFMMAAMIQLRDRAMAGGEPSEILAAVSNQLLNKNSLDMFVTVWLGILDLRTGRLSCANAGHEYPAIRDAAGHYTLLKDKHGMPLAAMEDQRYRGYELTLRPGEAVFVYTDGVAEASNAQEEFYGTDRMLLALNRAGSCSPAETLRAVRQSVDYFAAGAEQFDDLTMLCLEYHGEEKENH